MATDHQLNYDPTNPTPQGLPPLPKPDTHCLDDDTQRDVWSYSAELVQSYAREALAAQAATIEAICKIIECAGPEAADEIADLLGYPSVEWPSDQAASVEPVGEVGSMPGTSGFTMACFKAEDVPVGTKLYAGAPPSPASVQNASLVEKLAKRTCEANADSARFTIALQTLRASLDPDDWMGAVTMHNYIDAVLAGGSPLQQHPAPSPAQAVMQVGCENIDGTLNIHPETEMCSICEPAQAVDAVDSVDAVVADVLKDSKTLREKIAAELEKKLRAQLAAALKNAA